MKFGPIDFTQPSTWRGAIGFVGIFGLAVSPELTEQIAIAVGAALSAVEIFRDEYKRRQLPPITLEREALVSLVSLADRALQPDQQLRPPMPTEFDPTEDLPPPPGFSDR